MKPQPQWEIRYWDHVNGGSANINDCFGNSKKMIVKGRTRDEAIRRCNDKVRKNHSLQWPPFRLGPVNFLTNSK
jgi:hypothetical protein